MATPLYKRMKAKGTSFYAFPSAALDLNLANYNEFYNLNFTKFALLNIPRQESAADPIDGVMDFIPKRNDGTNAFYSDDPNYTTPITLSEQLVESLRNYVANYDTSLHESRINSNTDFYNIEVKHTPTELIFWKWCRKLNLIDFESAVHKVDWDKNLSDFDNPNNSTITHIDYFRKYLWKERDVINYPTVKPDEYTLKYEESEDYKGKDNLYRTPKFTINEIAKLKVGDKVILTGNRSDQNLLSGGTVAVTFGQSYEVGKITFDTGSTYIWLDVNFTGGGEGNLLTTYMYLDYHKLVEYVGEINQISNVKTASRVGQEITAYIPHQGGRTPTILYGIRDNSNYKPNLEIPILADEIQDKIVGAEDTTNSPIRKNPQDYPGSYYGQFDTNDNTYLCTNGDSKRYQGDYYGIKLTDNTGLDDEDYIEKLTDFNSDNIDGVFLDFDKDHYYKMNIPNLETQNFDEFSSLSIEGNPPDDFDFNAILWYYELVETDPNDSTKKVSYVNLYGIEFLNNPENDDDNYGTLISPYHKLVTNGSQDGLSYMFNLNLYYNIDNDVQPLVYDPSTIYNMFGFDMYNEMMSKFYKVNENFINIIQEFVRINMDLREMKSLIYSQTDVDSLKSRMNNMEELLRLYATNQFIDSDTARISTDYSGVYPKLQFNVIGVEYDQIENVSLTEAYNYNSSNSGISYPISLTFSNKMLLNLVNDNSYTENGNVTILLDRELKNKQKLDIVVKPEFAMYAQRLYVNMMYNYNNDETEINIFDIDLPRDLDEYNILSPDDSDFTDSYYMNENIYVNCTDVFTGSSMCSSGYTELIMTEDMFKTGNTIYVQNLFFKDDFGNVIDYSGAYVLIDKVGINITISLLTEDVAGYISIGQPRVSFYRGLKVSILRVDGSDNIPYFDQKYNIEYKII